jgi:hypothetical protein
MAAAAEADPQLQPVRRAAMLMDCLAVLRAAHPAVDAAQWGMGEFRRALRCPLAPLLPAQDAPGDGLGAVCLFDGDGLVRDALQDLCREHLVPQAALERHWPWARMRAEQEERRLFEVLRRLEPQEYRHARALLAESPAGPVRVLRRAWDRLWMRFDFFEAVSEPFQRGHRSSDVSAAGRRSATHEAPVPLSEVFEVSTHRRRSLVGSLSCRARPAACPGRAGHDAHRHPRG